MFVTAASSPFPDLAPGASAPADAPYSVYVDSGVPCGTPAVLRLDGTSDQGRWAEVLTLRVGVPAPTTETFVNATPKTIGDLATIRSWIVVQAPGVVQDLDVELSISHGWAPDLDVYLVSPGGTRVELSTDNGGIYGQNYTGTVLDDEASVPVQGTPAPFTGRFRPETPLSAVDGPAAVGTWTLEVTDDHVGVSGTLLRWAVDATLFASYACNACTVAAPPLEVPSLTWSGAAGDTLIWMLMWRLRSRQD